MPFSESIQNVLDKGYTLLEILGERSSVPEELKRRIEKEMDVDTLKRWLKLAIKADSLEEFIREL